MAASDLSKPLGQDQSEASGISRLFMFGSFGLLALVLLGLTSVIMLADNPDGGLPTQEVDLNASIDSNSRIGVSGIRPSIKPGIPETARPDQQDSPSPQLEQAMPANANTSDEIRVLDPADPSLNSATATNGTVPYEAFARPINTDAIAGLPKIAIIVDGLGLSQTTTEEALTLLRRI